MTSTYRNIGPRQRVAAITPQASAIPNSGQTKNAAGGFTWQADKWTQLNRFLILGSEGGSFYASEQKLTKDNAVQVAACIDENPVRVVDRIVEVSDKGLAIKNDPALFALAMVAGLSSPEGKRAALAALPKVARTGTHLFHFAAYVDSYRGWGRGLRSAFANWYTSKTADQVAFQAVKYQSRDGWGHRDLLRLSHARPSTETMDIVFKWIVKGWDSVGEAPHDDPALRQIWAAERLKVLKDDPSRVAEMVREYRIPHEAVPTEVKNDPAVVRALLEDMPITALIRNLATYTRSGVLAMRTAETKRAAEVITDTNRLRRGRVHPLSLLVALKTYASGHGQRGGNTWTPVNQLTQALDEAFYKAFEAVEPTEQRILIGLDVSGSMSSEMSGVSGLSAREAASALSLVIASTEPNVYPIMGFTGNNATTWGRSRASAMSKSPEKLAGTFKDNGITPVAISKGMRLDGAVNVVRNLAFGPTDCSLPMIYAANRGLEVDTFIVYTDNETWYGDIHPAQALKLYRKETGINARLIVVAMTAGSSSIADPSDPGMLDVVGFSTDIPTVMSAFMRGEF